MQNYDHEDYSQRLTVVQKHTVRLCFTLTENRVILAPCVHWGACTVNHAELIITTIVEVEITIKVKDAQTQQSNQPLDKPPGF